MIINNVHRREMVCTRCDNYGPYIAEGVDVTGMIIIDTVHCNIEGVPGTIIMNSVHRIRIVEGMY